MQFENVPKSVILAISELILKNSIFVTTCAYNIFY